MLAVGVASFKNRFIPRICSGRSILRGMLDDTVPLRTGESNEKDSTNVPTTELIVMPTSEEVSVVASVSRLHCTLVPDDHLTVVHPWLKTCADGKLSSLPKFRPSKLTSLMKLWGVLNALAHLKLGRLEIAESHKRVASPAAWSSSRSA